MSRKSYSPFPFFPIFFNALPFSFFYHCIILIRRSSLDNWIRIHLFFFSLNQCHSFAFALEKLCEAQSPMMIMKIFFSCLFVIVPSASLHASSNRTLTVSQETLNKIMCIPRSGQWSFTYTFRTRKTTLCITSTIHRLYIINSCVYCTICHADGYSSRTDTHTPWNCESM